MLKNSEVNFLIFFYLIECGYSHTAFSFKCESNLKFLKNKIKHIPPGLLISLIQRGIKYSQIESDFLLPKVDNFRSPIENFFFQKRNFAGKLYHNKFNSHLKTDKFGMLRKKDSNIQNSIWHIRKNIFFWSSYDSCIFKTKWDKCERKELKNKTIITENFGKEYIDSNKITALDMNLIGTIISCATFNGCIQLWSETGFLLFEKILSKIAIVELRWCENSDYITIGDLNGKILIWSIWNQSMIFESFLSLKFLKGLFYLNKNKILAYDDDNELSIFDLTNKLIQNKKSHFSKNNEFLYCSKNDRIASCHENKNISIWTSIDNLKLEYELKGHKKEVTCLQWKPFFFSKFGKISLLLSTSMDLSSKIWQVEKKRSIFTFFQDTPGVSVTWSLLGKEFSVGMIDKIINFAKENKKFELKEVYTRQPVFNLNSHSMNLFFLGFCNDTIVFY